MQQKQQKIEWSDSYLLGIPEIDGQHKELVRIANELYDAACGSDASYKANMTRVIKKLTDYTEYHFSHEEKNFMEKYGYPGLAVHKSVHAGFVKELNFRAKQLSSERKEDGMSFYAYMVNWILNHIAKTDKVWAAHVKAKLAN